MTPGILPPLTTALATCLAIVTTRGSPEDLPYSRGLFHISVATAILVGLLNRWILPDVTVAHAVINTAGEYAILLYGLHLLLGIREMLARFVKVATAILLISTMGGATLFLLRWFGSPVTSIIVATVFIAQLSGALTCLRRGMDVHWLIAGFYLFAYLWIAMLFFRMTASMMDGPTAGGGARYAFGVV
ncbi:MAG: hypothetical protein ACR2RB_01350 [Gammaproteobacteria bacterium]